MPKLFIYIAFSYLLGIAQIAHAQTEPPLSDAMKVFKSGDYKTAIPLLRTPVPKEQEAITRAALLSALVYEGKADEAADLSESLAVQYPEVPEIMVARGELLYYLGDVFGADRLFRSAQKSNPKLARAYLGLYRLLHAASYYRSARLNCLSAHQLDPDDALITLTFLRYLVGDKRRELVGPFMQAHPWFAEHYQQETQNSVDLHKELAERKPFEQEGQPQEVTLHLIELLYGANRIRGFGLEVTVEDNRPLRLLLDTGASGIVLKQSAVDKAGLKHIGATESWGVGNGTTRKGFNAFASSCTIGKMPYKNCLFEAMEGKGRIAGDEDGLIGTDFFSGYLIHLDFQQHLMHLKPLLPREPNAQGYDRTIPADEADFTPIFRFGHELMIPTKVNGKSSGLFLLDTGASESNIDSSFARLSTKIRGDEYTTVRGVSGKVQNVYAADKAELEFGHFRQSNLGLTAFDLNNISHHQEVRMSGILGMPVLVLFRLDLDYRNGLVKFDYILKRN